MAERAERPERGNRELERYPQIEEELEKCKDFLANYKVGNDHPYSMQLQDIANRDRKLLEIQLDDVLSYKQDEDFVTNIKRNSKRYIKLFESAAELNLPTASRPVRSEDVFDILVKQRRATLEQIATDNGTAIPREVDIPRYITRRFDVVLVPLSEDMKLPRKLREVKASDIGHLVTVKGMVTRANDVKPYIVGCTYICDTCGSEIYQEITGSSFMPTNTCPSQRCIDNKTPGRVNMLTRGSKFIKYQELRVQELPDQVPVGHIPRSITVQCKGEATRSCGPGDIVVISGIFLAAKAPHAGFRGGKVGLQSSTYLEACKVDQQKQNYADMASGLDSETQKVITEISEDPDPYSRLSQSIAPEIFGHEDVKKALLLQLVGGVSRSLSDGMKIRGDINICLMGDPGVAKSQLLKFIAGAAPRGVYTTGKGSSGVGLTAAVIRDPITGDLSLEGGALVLADMGICCIDEFDKMDDSDRTAIHEVMEQQTISIAKAGITTTLNARAAVLAAANPLYGRYNKRKSISENVDLPNSLLSRFDLMFLLLDKANMETDLALSRHVLHVHRYLKNPKSAFTPLSPAMVKQYISIARAITPVVPQELTSYIVEAYVSLRSKDTGAGHGSGSKGNHTDQAVLTARQLLSILRLSQGLARLRLSNTIGHEDVDEAMRLVHSSKSSLLDDGPAVQQEDVTSAIYSIMRDLAAQRGTSSVDFNQIEMMIVKKGYSSQQLRNCINEYESLGVLSTVDNGSTIIFD
jgi:DNA replication licensing factor MCM7